MAGSVILSQAFTLWSWEGTVAGSIILSQALTLYGYVERFLWGLVPVHCLV